MRSAVAVAHPGCTWLAIEPNMLNPYTFTRQRFIAGERNFVPRSALRAGRDNGWRWPVTATFSSYRHSSRPQHRGWSHSSGGSRCCLPSQVGSA